MAEYKVQLPVFEGPLDLLLYLIRKEEVDIYEVNLTHIATQFIEYIELMRQLDLDVAGEFLVMAATLMYIKSRELLPVEQQEDQDDEEEEMDPRWELIRQLVEYKKFKEMAGRFQTWELAQDSIYPRQPGMIHIPPAEEKLKIRISLMDLLTAVNAILSRMTDADDAPEIMEERWTVSQKITMVQQWLKDNTRGRFSDLFSQAASRFEVVVTFLAVLELVRLKHASVSQSDVFGEIEITHGTEINN